MKEFFIAFFVLAYFIGLLLVVIFDYKFYKEDIFMWIKKTGKKIKGSGFTKEEEAAIELEVQRRLGQTVSRLEIDAMILWILHDEFEFGTGRLKRFYKRYVPAMADVSSAIAHNDWDSAEGREFTSKLAEYGVNVGDLFNEIVNEMSDEW